MKMFRVMIPLLLLLGFGISCNPEVDVFAVERELYIVHGVLNPNAEEQYVRVSKIFQTDGDAVVFAAENDISAKGFRATLTGAGQTYQADLVTNIPRGPGVFFPAQALYRFRTAGAMALEPGARYSLEIRKPDDPDFLISAYTDIPTAPVITSPGGALYSPAQNLYTYNSVDFTDDVVIRFDAGSGNGWELRVYADFWDGREFKTAQYGPTPVFQEPTGCKGKPDRGKLCYEVRERQVPVSFLRYTNEAPGPVRLYDTVRVASSEALLSKDVRIEITGIDTFLTTYLRAETAFGFGLNFLMDKPAVSNISGENIGIFGSFNTGIQYVYLDPCTQFLSGFAPSAPSGCF